MDNVLQSLLAAEQRAEEIVRQAEEERERIIKDALHHANLEEERFTKRIPDLQASYIKKAEQRAAQAQGELKKRYDERHVQLRNLAEAREAEALDAAYRLLIDPEADG